MEKTLTPVGKSRLQSTLSSIKEVSVTDPVSLYSSHAGRIVALGMELGLPDDSMGEYLKCVYVQGLPGLARSWRCGQLTIPVFKKKLFPNF
jgi:hypothetical protein